MRVGSLFSGIGGIDLGLERAGMQVVWQAEIDPYASKVLNKHWPDVPNLGDVTVIDWRQVEREHGKVDLICGGFPCQPVSVAGKGQAQKDKRWIWPEAARCIQELRPRYVLLENTPGLLTAAQGRAAQEVFGNLAACGYDFEWDCVPAAAVGAPHLRYRVFIVGYTGSSGRRGQSGVGPAIGRQEGGDVADPGGSRSGVEAHRGGGQRRQPAGTLQPADLRQEHGEAGAEGADPGGGDVADPERPRLQGRAGIRVEGAGQFAQSRERRGEEDVADPSGNGRRTRPPSAPQEGQPDSRPEQGGVVSGRPEGHRVAGGDEGAGGQGAVSDPDGGRRQVLAQLDGQPHEGPPDGHPRGQHPDRPHDDVADPDLDLMEGRQVEGQPGPEHGLATVRRRGDGAGENVADPDVEGRGERAGGGKGWRAESANASAVFDWLGDGARWASNWAVEPDVGRVAHGVPARVDRLTCLGNAVVPQVAEWLGARIIELDRLGGG